LLHPFFDDLKLPEAALPNGKDFPPLFEFTHEEIGFIGPELVRQLVPLHLQMDPWFIEIMDSMNVGKDGEE
jgi:glycogen synthase kinase 3 beta